MPHSSPTSGSPAEGRTPPALGRDGRVLEGLVTTLNADGSVHLAPMGPLVGADQDRLWLRPYATSTTYGNLCRTPAGVFHVTDDVELLARAALGAIDDPPATRPAGRVPGAILVDACRWYAFQVESVDDSQPRTEIVARVVDRGLQREFFGFNRAKHAVVEAAILATRLDLLPRDQILAELARLEPWVAK
ncbi:MAG TPA: DUF447 family protein, partial [Lacipirellulaceae bacterium]|nr:DUF447 family protein [Lacipirellulaceae bacterium]